jgi:hypothetical protein
MGAWLSGDDLKNWLKNTCRGHVAEASATSRVTIKIALEDIFDLGNKEDVRRW